MPPPILFRTARLFPVPDSPHSPRLRVPTLRDPGTVLRAPDVCSATAPSCPAPATTEGAIAAPRSRDAGTATPLVTPEIIAAVAARDPSVSTLPEDILALRTEVEAAAALITTTEQQLAATAEIDPTLRDQLVDAVALRARFATLAAAALQLQSTGMALCALDMNDESSATLVALDAALEQAATQLSAMARYVVIGESAEVFQAELEGAVSVRRSVELGERVERALASGGAADSREPALYPGLVAELDGAIGDARETLRVLREHDGDARRAERSDPLTRVSADATRAGHLANREGGTISLREQIETLEQTITALSAYRSSLAERWPTLRRELDRALATFGLPAVTSMTRAGLQDAFNALAGAVGIAPAPTLDAGSVTYARICEVALPLLHAVAEVEFGTTHMAAQLLQQVFGETGDLPTPGATLEAIDTQRNTTLLRLRNALGSTASVNDMAEQVLAFARDTAAQTPILDALNVIAAGRSSTSASDVAVLQLLVEEQGVLSVDTLRRLANDYSMSLEQREALWPLLHTPGGRALVRHGLTLDAIRTLRTEVSVFGVVPVGSLFPNAVERGRRLVEVLGSGPTATRLQHVFDGLSADQVGYLITRHDRSHSPSVAEQLVAQLSGAELGDAIAVLENGDACHAEADALARSLSGRRASYALGIAEGRLNAVDRELVSDTDIPRLASLNPSRVSEARRAAVEARSALDSYRDAMQGDDVAAAAAALMAFSRALVRAEAEAHRVSRMSQYALNHASAQMGALRDLGAATAVAGVAALATGGTALAMMAEGGAPVLAMGGVLFAGTASTAGIAAGALAYAPIAMMDLYFGESEYAHFHFREACLTAVSASVGTALSLVSIAGLASSGVAVSGTTRALVLGVASADAALVSGGADVLTTIGAHRAEERRERLERLPVDVLRAFVGGAVLSALRLPTSGLAGHLANGGVGAIEHLAWQGLTHGELTDGLGEAVVQSVAIGSIMHTLQLGQRFARSPRLRAGRRVSFENQTFRVRHVSGEMVTLANTAGGPLVRVPAWMLVSSNPEILRSASARTATSPRTSETYREAAHVPAAAHDYAVTPLRLHADDLVGVEWLPESHMNQANPTLSLSDGYDLVHHADGLRLRSPDGALMDFGMISNWRVTSVSRDGRYFRIGPHFDPWILDFGAHIEAAAADADH